MSESEAEASNAQDEGCLFFAIQAFCANDMYNITLMRPDDSAWPEVTDEKSGEAIEFTADDDFMGKIENVRMYPEVGK